MSTTARTPKSATPVLAQGLNPIGQSAPPTAATPTDASLVERLARAEMELAGIHAELERLHRLASIGTIAGMIAHEFNNILTPIVSYSQMAIAAPDDQDLVQKALRRTLAGSERAAKIADAILSFVREDAARAGDGTGDMFHVEQAPPAAAHVAGTIADALACLGRDTGADEGGTRLHVPASIHVAMQPIALQQVLVNLILNARNAMRGSGGLLEISASRWLEEPACPKGAVDSRTSGYRAAGESDADNIPAVGRPSPWICIVVRDSGRGMNAERLARLFRPFDTSGGGEQRGTGLGMVITKRLVERAGGWLIVESALGRGTTMTIVLPEAAASI